MNINEVLKFAATLNDDEQPSGADLNAPGPSKRPRLEPTAAGSSKLTEEEIAKILEDAEAQPINEVTESEIKRLITVLEKRYNKNQEMRIKYGDDPPKFLDSEMELFDTIKELGCVSTRIDLYDVLTKQKFVPILLSLLSHDNLDLVHAVIVLLSETLVIEEADDLDTSMELIKAFLSNQLIQLLIQTMDKCSGQSAGGESGEESVEEYITPVLEIFEFLCENRVLTPEEYPAEMALMIGWLLRKVKEKPVFSASKQFASEILSVSLQMYDGNRKIFNQLNGIDTLLRVIAHYKRQDPETDEEEELMTNLFNTLCASLQDSLENRQSFYDEEGLELMNLILKERRDPKSQTLARLQALKVVSHCFSIGTEDDLLKKFCDKYVEILGLRILMPLFQKPASILPAKYRKKPEVGEVEEHSVAILVALFAHCKPENILRLLHKFVESEFIKTERLVELYTKYTELVSKNVPKKKTQETYSLAGFVLQLICQLILIVSTADEQKGRSGEITTQIKERLFKLIKMNPSHRATFVDNVKRIASELAVEKSDQEAKELAEMIQKF